MLTLMIVGFKCDPSRITEILGLAPTNTQTAGETSPRSGRPHRKSAWHMSVGENIRITSGSEHAVALRQLLSLIAGRETQFAAMQTEAQPEFISISGGYYRDDDEQSNISPDCDEMGIMFACGIDWGLGIRTRELNDTSTE